MKKTKLLGSKLIENINYPRIPNVCIFNNPNDVYDAKFEEGDLLDANSIKDLLYEIGADAENFFMVLGTVQDGKPMLSCYVSKELSESRGYNAGQVVRELGKYIQGGGGGQAFFATAGGKNPEGMQEAIDNALSFIK